MVKIQSRHSTGTGTGTPIDIDRNTGYCPRNQIYRSLRPATPLPPPSTPLSIASYALSLLHSPTTPTSFALSTTAFLIDASTGASLTYSTFLQRITSLTFSLAKSPPSPLSKNDVAFILAPSSLHIPVLYLSLLSLGVVVSPSNPLSTPSELAHQINLCKPSIVFSTSAFAYKLPPNLPVILLDSPQFLSMIEARAAPSGGANNAVVIQSDPATILYSSGTTGNVKGVVLTHRNLIALTAGLYHSKLLDALKAEEEENSVAATPVSLFTLPLFHVFGFFMLIRLVALGETVVVMEKFDFVAMLEAIEKYRVRFMPVSPPLVVALTKSDLVKKYDLSSLQRLGSGGAPLGKEVAERFRAKFPHVEIFQGYGLTESAGAGARTIEPEEAEIYGSAGPLTENMDAKIVDPESGESLPPGKRGELWLRGPTIMKGYAGDSAATAATLDSEGWLKTGDLCYFDSNGHLFIIDRLKELIKYKGYQVPPAELEHILQSMPDVADTAVIPYPDEEVGQIPMAYIVRKPCSTVSATQIMDFVANQVAPYKKIRRIAFVDAIPRSPAGKILRRQLVNHALCGPSSKL